MAKVGLAVEFPGFRNFTKHNNTSLNGLMGETELFHDRFKHLTDIDKVTLGRDVERLNFEILISKIVM